MKIVLIAAAAMMMPLGAAHAQLSPARLAQDFVAAGYSRVEVKTGPTQTKVEAWSATTKMEVIYDTATGTLLKTESEMLTGTAPVAGTSIRERGRDFVRGWLSAAVTDDAGGKGRGRGRGTDDGPGDDKGGKGKGSDDRPGDDKGGRGKGSDDRPGDDKGGRGKGSDDRPGDDKGGRGKGGKGGDDGPGDDNGGKGRGTDH